MSALWGALVSIPFALLTAAGIAIYLKPEASQLPYVGLGLWFVFLITFVTPYKIWARQKTEIAQMQASLEPKLSLRFDPGPVCMHRNVQGGFTQRLFCVIAKNESKISELQNCHVDLVCIEPYDHSFISTAMRTIENRDTFSLSRDQEALIQVASLREPNWQPPDGKIDESQSYGKTSGDPRQKYTQNGLPFDENKNLIHQEIQLHYGWDTSKRYIPQGRYTIKLKAFSDKAPSVERNFLIDVLDGELKFQEVPKDGHL